MRRLLPFVLAALPALAPVAAAGQDAVPPSLAGAWQGTLVVDGDALRIGLVVDDTAGRYEAYLVVIDQDGARLPVERVALTGTTLRLDIGAVPGGFTGTLAADGQAITGTLGQGALPLTFARVDALDSPPTFGDAELAEVRAVIDRYFRTFSEQDWATYRTVFTAPIVLWSVGTTPQVVETVEEMVASMRTVRESFDGTVYAVSRAERMIVTPLSARSALVDVHWRRDAVDGSLISEGAEILAVVATADGWKITANMGRSLGQFGLSFCSDLTAPADGRPRDRC